MGANNPSVHESEEDYLETILILTHRNGMVRSIDIATEMNFSKPSISIAMKKLRLSGKIEMDETGYITLTPAGREIAERTYSRHILLTDCLAAIGVSPETAEREACRIEHLIDEETYECIRRHWEKYNKHKEAHE